MKNIVIHQSCARPTSKTGDIVYVDKPARGGDLSNKSGKNVSVFKKRAYRGNQMLTVLAKATKREENTLAKGMLGHAGAPRLRAALPHRKCPLFVL